MLSYQQLKYHPRVLRAFTGLDPSEFEKLLVPFAMAYHAYIYDQHVIKKARQRRYGGGRKPRLAAMEDKLFFILFYYKVYPLQEVLAFLFETSQGRVNAMDTYSQYCLAHGAWRGTGFARTRPKESCTNAGSLCVGGLHP